MEKGVVRTMIRPRKRDRLRYLIVTLVAVAVLWSIVVVVGMVVG